MVTGPRTSSRASRAMDKANRALPQQFPLQRIDLSRDYIKSPDVNQGTSPRVDYISQDGETSHYRKRDDMRPLPSPDKNRNTYSVADNAAISMGHLTTETSTHGEYRYNV